jgi:hypothetical protein
MGQVTDPTKANLPHVTITLTSSNTNARYGGETNESGSYLIPSIPPGEYSIEVDKIGFMTIIKPNVVLHIQDIVELNFEMRLGSRTETVTVTGEAALVHVSTSSTGDNISAQQLADFPVNGRNYLDLMELVPGVTVNQQADQGTDASTPVMGERGGNTGYLIDGYSNENEFDGGAAAQFNQDTIGEGGYPLDSPRPYRLWFGFGLR